MTIPNSVPSNAETDPAMLSETSDRSNAVISGEPSPASKPDSPPFQRRIMANRENARKSTGPKTSEGKASSRRNAIRHGLSAKVSLPREVVVEVAEHFWQSVCAYRPVDAVAVNAILELTICSWKFRRLFEQYASRNARVKLTVNDDRKARDQRLAHRWFRLLPVEPRKSLAYLERTTTGLALIVEHIDNLIVELEQPEGTWTSRQFQLAINLGGFHDHEIWDEVVLRNLWSAWISCRPGRKNALDESQSYLPVNPEYRTRARKAIEAAPLPADARRTLLDWVKSVRNSALGKIESRSRVEADLQVLQPMSSGWPSPEETSQHMLYLRYSNQVDRKARELGALIASRPAGSAEDWKFDEELLPSDWKSVLLQHRMFRSVMAGIENGNYSEEFAEIMLMDNIFDVEERRIFVSSASPTEIEETREPVNPSVERARTEMDSDSKLLPSISDCQTASNEPTNFVADHMPAGTADSCVQAIETSMADSKPAQNEIMPNSKVVESRSGASVPISIVRGDRNRTPNTSAPDQTLQEFDPLAKRGSHSSGRSRRRRLRPDKAADVRRDRHQHAMPRPARASEPGSP
jgi:hypothetical protein